MLVTIALPLLPLHAWWSNTHWHGTPCTNIGMMASNTLSTWCNTMLKISLGTQHWKFEIISRTILDQPYAAAVPNAPNFSFSSPCNGTPANSKGSRCTRWSTVDNAPLLPLLLLGWDMAEFKIGAIMQVKPTLDARQSILDNSNSWYRFERQIGNKLKG